MGRPPCCDKIMGVKKGPWMVEEDIVLASYVQEHGPGNWRSVPASTGLARCSKSCRLRWVNYLRPGIRRGGFTPHEDNVIIHLQSLLGNRPPCCDKIMGVKKGPWMVEEDIVLASYVQEHGPGNWRSVPASTGLARCSKSCRLRWVNYLRPGIRRGGFTPLGDNVIIHLQSLLGNRWATIASYLPWRTDNDIKNYWNTHLSKRLKKQEAMGAIFALPPPPPPPKSAAFSSSSSSSSYAYSVDNISRLLADFMKASAPQASAPTKSSQSASYADAKPSTVVHVIEANEYPLPPTFDDYCISGTGIAAELINSVDDQQQVSLSSIEKWLIDEAAETMDELTSSDACYSVPMLF